MPAEFRARWLHMLYLHGCHLANNLSFYFSPNNHLVGEALALHALGLFFAGFQRAARWERLGARVMREQMDRQIRADGSSFEQSTYYQVYLLDMFRLHAVLATARILSISPSWSAWPSFCTRSPDLPGGCRPCSVTTTADACRSPHTTSMRGREVGVAAVSRCRHCGDDLRRNSRHRRRRSLRRVALRPQPFRHAEHHRSLGRR